MRRLPHRQPARSPSPDHPRLRHRRAAAVGPARRDHLALTRENLLNQREDAADRRRVHNARIVQRRVERHRPRRRCSRRCSHPSARDRSSTTATSTVSRNPAFGRDALPAELKEMVESGQPARMRYELDGEMQLAVGVPIPSADVAYFEIVSLDDVEDTLEALGVSLVGAVARDDPGRRGARLVGEPAGPPTARRRLDGGDGAGRRTARHPARRRATTPTSARSPRRSTRWPRPCRTGSSATPASRPTSATSSGRRS